jgi:hypothetical protein
MGMDWIDLAEGGGPLASYYTQWYYNWASIEDGALVSY